MRNSAFHEPSSRLPCQKNLRACPCLHVFVSRVITPKNLSELYYSRNPYEAMLKCGAEQAFSK